MRVEYAFDIRKRCETESRKAETTYLERALSKRLQNSTSNPHRIVV